MLQIGINKPVYTSIGPYYGDDASNAIGYLKASPDGKRLASVRYFYYGAECQVYDFDNKSGKIYNPILIDSVKKGYGVEFSPDSRLLYVGHDSHRRGICKIFQYDLGQADTSKIKRNGYLVIAGLESTGALQLGPDKKIYIAQNFVTYLHTIESPNERGSKCNFVLNSTPLGGEFSTLGLPTFIQSYFEPKTDFTCQNSCVGNICQFKTFSKLKPDKWHWNFGDSTSGRSNISYLQNANHIFTTSGKYRVKLIITSGSFTDTVEKEITVYKMPIANLGADIIVCDTLPITLFAGEAEHYNWSTGNTTKQISVAKSGAYWVKLKNGSCTATDTINVTFLQEKDFEIGNDTIICAGESITLRNNIPNAKYMWSTASQDSAITVNKEGKYWLATLINDCIKTDTINIKVIPLPTVELGKDTFLCEGDEMELNANNTGAQFIWSTGENTQTIKAGNTGKYWVTVNSHNCISADTITLKICPPNIFVPNAFTPDNDSTNDVFRVYGSDISEAELKIFNRWGECVFETKDLKQGWNGTFKNKLCPVERYVWILRYKGKIAPQAHAKQISGIVDIIR